MRLTILFASTALTLAACSGGGGANESAEASDSLATDNMATGEPATGNTAATTEAGTAADYVATAAASDMFEIESARLAQQKAQDAEVKAFAGMLVTDHEKSTAELKTAAAQVQPPVPVLSAMTAEQQGNVQALQAASGADFDKLFLSQQIPAHETALALVQGYAASGDAAPLKQHASTVAAPIQRHLDQAKQLQGKIGQ
ncbi:DUF4142 domain-containing protein [Sphingomonas parva]|uniref:DUF4142 domain-containing protein n=1 Tax=Sphingomonas parva TaxID=2555898 RepID=A0A4Y8ZS33_9SPHN|nr:DUF4142 domain-containing protein [Sphingomonas parva]TFI58823.1 DUF4142 domain-containing protein [Sphingomonas parva]